VVVSPKSKPLLYILLITSETTTLEAVLPENRDLGLWTELCTLFARVIVAFGPKGGNRFWNAGMICDKGIPGLGGQELQNLKRAMKHLRNSVGKVLGFKYLQAQLDQTKGATIVKEISKGYMIKFPLFEDEQQYVQNIKEQLGMIEIVIAGLQ
jgi:hypothetical protein